MTASNVRTPRLTTAQLIKSLAFQGAQQRFQEIEAEIDALTITFPDLVRAATPTRKAKPAKTAAKRRNRTMNAAQRREVSERMTKYWAAWREKKAAKQAASAGKSRKRKKAQQVH
jgi:hypothetical protein